MMRVKNTRTCLKRPLSKRPKMVFKTNFSLNAGQKYCRMLNLQYYKPSLSYHLSSRSLFYQFLSGRLRKVLLYNK